mgnify:CR=1 FL=1
MEAGSGLAFIGADSQVAYMLETATSKGDSIRFDPWKARRKPSNCSVSCWRRRNARTSRSDSQEASDKVNDARDNDDSIRSKQRDGKTEVSQPNRIREERKTNGKTCRLKTRPTPSSAQY